MAEKNNNYQDNNNDESQEEELRSEGESGDDEQDEASDSRRPSSNKYQGGGSHGGSGGGGGGHHGGGGSGGGGGGGGGGGSGKAHQRPSVDPSKVTNRVYVGNLAYETRWQDLKDHFREAGNVVFAEVLMGIDGRSKGCGIVEFESKEEALNAIEKLNDSGLDDRLIFVREDREAGHGPRRANMGRGGGGGSTAGRKLFIGNLPWSTTWQDLKDAFSQCGGIIRADILVGPDGRSRGQGTIIFENPDEAKSAIDQFHNTKFQGRTILVREDKFG